MLLVDFGKRSMTGLAVSEMMWAFPFVAPAPRLGDKYAGEFVIDELELAEQGEAIREVQSDAAGEVAAPGDEGTAFVAIGVVTDGSVEAAAKLKCEAVRCNVPQAVALLACRHRRTRGRSGGWQRRRRIGCRSTTGTAVEVEMKLVWTGFAGHEKVGTGNAGGLSTRKGGRQTRRAAEEQDPPYQRHQKGGMHAENLHDRMVFLSSGNRTSFPFKTLDTNLAQKLRFRKKSKAGAAPAFCRSLTC